MRWRICNGLVLGQAVDAYIKKATHCQTQKGEYDYQSYFHGCLLWTYHRLEVNRYPMENDSLLSIASCVQAGPSLDQKGGPPFWYSDTWL
jgi:hypothetical protein